MADDPRMTALMNMMPNGQTFQQNTNENLTGSTNMPGGLMGEIAKVEGSPFAQAIMQLIQKLTGSNGTQPQQSQSQYDPIHPFKPIDPQLHPTGKTY